MRRSLRRTAFLSVLALTVLSCAEPATQPLGEADMARGAADVGTLAAIPEFPIITTPAKDDRAGGAAWDGSNYLIGYTTGTPPQVQVYARLLSPAGTRLATISTGRKGNAPLVAFDGTNYLLAWGDQNSLFAPNIYGQFISTAGAKVGTAFQITTTNDAIVIGGLCYGGGQYFVSYTRIDSKIHRQFVSPAGVLGTDVTVSSGQGFGFNSCASDGTNFLTTWVDAQNWTRARLVRGNGTLGAELALDQSPDSTNAIIPVAFLGGNYLVGWTDKTNGSDWNIYSARVTAAGAVLGIRRSIMATAGTAQILNGITANGSNFAAYYLDDVAGLKKARVRFLNPNGVTAGPGQLVFNPKLGRPVVGGPMVVHGTTYFFGANRATPGLDPLDFGSYTAWDLYGAVGTLVP